MVCSLSAEHRDHSAVPIREVALQYTDKLAEWLPPLKTKRELLEASKAKDEEEVKATRNNLETEKMKTLAEFRQLRQLLREQEDATLARLEGMHNKVTRTENTNLVKRLQQISSIDALIREIETKCAQPAEELLKDVRSTLTRCENEIFQEQENSTNDYKRKDTILNDVKVVEPEMEIRKHKVPVTLDRNAAHPDLVTLSEGGRRVRGIPTPEGALSGSNRCFT